MNQKRKEEEIVYKDEYFYTLKSWWISCSDSQYRGCQRINKDLVPKPYLIHFNQE